MTFSKCGGVDFHDSVTNQVRGAAMSGPQSYNGTYDQVLFTQRAVELIDVRTLLALCDRAVPVQPRLGHPERRDW